ncbi:hypothetical protein ACHAXT_011146 [Thalassiosira profunda]
MPESLGPRQASMNYEGGGGDQEQGGWDILLGVLEGGTVTNDPLAPNPVNTAGASGAPTTNYDSTGYGAYLQGNFANDAAGQASYTSYAPAPATGLNYGGNAGYSVTVPAATQGQYTPQYGQPAQASGGGQSAYVSGDQPQCIGQPVGGAYGDNPHYFNTTATGVGGGYVPAASANNGNFSGNVQNIQTGQNSYNPPATNTTNTGDSIDYCDALLRGMDDPNFGYMVGGNAFGAGGGNATNNIHAASGGRTTGFNSYQQGHQQSRGLQGLGGEQMSLPTTSNHTQNNGSALDYFFGAQLQQQQAAAHSQIREDHSSLPSVQIDPLLEEITLTVSAVSLEPLSGNAVVRHVRTKTDDVITRFLPCVDFLVNCQQELRQGLQLAQRSRSRSQGRSRGAMGMTPRQFHTTYVAPLPRRFERHNEAIMAREHLTPAKQNLEQLVRESQACIPQGCEHVKNAFLGGMRENESWGLRKWLSKNGGAGSICNDLEEVMRHVKALDKELDTTKRLMSMLRPIAGQAHDRLKKDVPAAYQEQSTAHPYLPFFHRLESCLKQMATYDPEEDDVICLADSSDEEDDVKFFGGGDEEKKKPVAPPKAKAEPEIICLDSSSDEEDENDKAVAKAERKPAANTPAVTTKTEEKTKETPQTRRSGSLSPLPPASPLLTEEYEFGQSALHKQLQLATAAAAAKEKETSAASGNATTTTAGEGGSQWRCQQCTFLNEAFAAKCQMCNDSDSDNGGNKSDDLANFLGGSGFFGGSSNHSFSADSLEQSCHRGGSAGQNQQWKALQSADARELECLADHISKGGSLPKQAHRGDRFWGTQDLFPSLLLIFRTLLQSPISYRFLEPVDESHLFMMGLPAYSSAIRHPLCFHAIVSSLSKSEDALKYPHLTMRLSDGNLPGNDEVLRTWNMWNGLHLIEAIDLVLLNSLAYNALHNAGRNDSQLRSETERLRNVLWDGVNGIMNERLQSYERMEHTPQRRSPNSGFVVANRGP